MYVSGKLKLDLAIWSLQSDGDVHRVSVMKSKFHSMSKKGNVILIKSFELISHSHAALDG